SAQRVATNQSRATRRTHQVARILRMVGGGAFGGGGGGGSGLLRFRFLDRLVGMAHSRSKSGKSSCRGSLGTPGPRQRRLRCREARPRTFSPCATSRFIGEAAPLGTLDGQRSALHVINA